MKTSQLENLKVDLEEFIILVLTSVERILDPKRNVSSGEQHQIMSDMQKEGVKIRRRLKTQLPKLDENLQNRQTDHQHIQELLERIDNLEKLVLHLESKIRGETAMRGVF